MSTLAKNVSQVVLYENQVSDFVAFLWMQTPLGHWINSNNALHFVLRATVQSTTFHTELKCVIRMQPQRIPVYTDHIISG